MEPTDLARMRSCAFWPAPHVVWTTIRGETFVFDIESGTYETLNAVAGSAWNVIVQGATVRQITDALRDEYEIGSGAQAEQMVNDVVELLRRLESRHVVTSEPVA